MSPVVLGLHAVWRELVLRHVLDVSHAPTSDGGLVVVRVRWRVHVWLSPAWWPRRELLQRNRRLRVLL